MRLIDHGRGGIGIYSYRTGDILAIAPDLEAAHAWIADWKTRCTALEFLKHHIAVPGSSEHPNTDMSNSEIRRHLKQGAVRINGVCPQPGDRVTFPIEDLVWWPKGKKRRHTIR